MYKNQTLSSTLKLVSHFGEIKIEDLIAHSKCW